MQTVEAFLDLEPDTPADTVVEIDPARQVYWVKGRGGGWLNVQAHPSLPYTCSCADFLRSRGHLVEDCHHVQVVTRYRNGQ